MEKENIKGLEKESLESLEQESWEMVEESLRRGISRSDWRRRYWSDWRRRAWSLWRRIAGRWWRWRTYGSGGGEMGVGKGRSLVLTFGCTTRWWASREDAGRSEPCSESCVFNINKQGAGHGLGHHRQRVGDGCTDSRPHSTLSCCMRSA